MSDVSPPVLYLLKRSHGGSGLWSRYSRAALYLAQSFVATAHSPLESVLRVLLKYVGSC